MTVVRGVGTIRYHLLVLHYHLFWQFSARGWDFPTHVPDVSDVFALRADELCEQR